jgi:hypothetical protein
MSTARVLPVPEEKTPSVEMFLSEIEFRLRAENKSPIDRFKSLVGFLRENNFESAFRNHIKSLDLAEKLELISGTSAKYNALASEVLKLVSEPSINAQKESGEVTVAFNKMLTLITDEGVILQGAFSEQEQVENKGPLPIELRPMWEAFYKNPNANVKEYIGFMQFITTTYMQSLCDFALALAPGDEKRNIAAKEIREFKEDFEKHLAGYTYSNEAEKDQTKTILEQFAFLLALLTPVPDKKNEKKPQRNLRVNTDISTSNEAALLTPVNTFKTSSAAVLSSLPPVSSPVEEAKAFTLISPPKKAEACIAPRKYNYTTDDELLLREILNEGNKNDSRPSSTPASSFSPH